MLELGRQGTGGGGEGEVGCGAEGGGLKRLCCMHVIGTNARVWWINTQHLLLFVCARA